jgi:hypothetical protein
VGLCWANAKRDSISFERWNPSDHTILNSCYLASKIAPT